MNGIVQENWGGADLLMRITVNSVPSREIRVALRKRLKERMRVSALENAREGLVIERAAGGIDPGPLRRSRHEDSDERYDRLERGGRLSGVSSLEYALKIEGLRPRLTGPDKERRLGDGRDATAKAYQAGMLILT